MKTVVITGRAGGFGFELAKEFRANSYNVVISDINEKKLNDAKEKLLKQNGVGQVVAEVCDVTDCSAIESLWANVVKKFVSVDVWINNAGVNQPDKAIYELSKEEIDFVFKVDLLGAIYGSKIAFAKMKEQGFGQIYNVEGYGSNDAMMKGLNI